MAVSVAEADALGEAPSTCAKTGAPGRLRDLPACPRDAVEGGGTSNTGGTGESGDAGDSGNTGVMSGGLRRETVDTARATLSVIMCRPTRLKDELCLLLVQTELEGINEIT